VYNGFTLLKREWNGESGILAWFMGFEDANDVNDGADVSFDQLLGEVNRVLFPGEQVQVTSGFTGRKGEGKGKGVRFSADQRDQGRREGGSSRVLASPPRAARGIAPRLNLAQQFPSAFTYADEEQEPEYASPRSASTAAGSDMPPPAAARVPASKNMYQPVNTSRTSTRHENLKQSVPLSESTHKAVPSNFKPQSEFHQRSRRGRSPSVRPLPQAPTVSEGIYSNQNRADSQALLNNHSMYSQNLDFGRGSLPGTTSSSRRGDRKKGRRQFFNALGL